MKSQSLKRNLDTIEEDASSNKKHKTSDWKVEIDYYDDDQTVKFSELWIYDGNKRLYKTWNNDGTLVYKREWKDDIQKHTYYYKNNRLKSYHETLNDKMHNTQQRWEENGDLEYSCKWRLLFNNLKCKRNSKWRI